MSLRSILSTGKHIQQQAELHSDDVFVSRVDPLMDPITLMGPNFNLQDLLWDATAVDHLSRPTDEDREEWLRKLTIDNNDTVVLDGSKIISPKMPENMKPSVNPKDAFGICKWRQFMTVPARVLWEVGVAMLEGAMKYGRHNYRISGVQASIYTDAAKGHIDAWIEGEDVDPDSGLSHITKAITSLIVLRDGMIEGNFVDDRPPAHQTMDAHKAGLQALVDRLFEKYPEPVLPYTEQHRKVVK